MKISEAIEDYILEIEIRKYAERTVAIHRDKARCFERFCAHLRAVRWNQIAKDEDLITTAYLRSLRDADIIEMARQ